MFMKTQAAPILRRYGFRRVLVVNALIAACSSRCPALFTPATPSVLIIGLFLVGGFVALAAVHQHQRLAYADVPTRLSRATSFAAVCQELSGSVGVSVAALGLEMIRPHHGAGSAGAGQFPARVRHDRPAGGDVVVLPVAHLA